MVLFLGEALKATVINGTAIRMVWSGMLDIDLNGKLYCMVINDETCEAGCDRGDKWLR